MSVCAVAILLEVPFCFVVMPLIMPSSIDHYGFTKIPVAPNETRFHLLAGRFTENDLEEYWQNMLIGGLATIDAAVAVIQLSSGDIDRIIPTCCSFRFFGTLDQYTFEIIKHVLKEWQPSAPLP